MLPLKTLPWRWVSLGLLGLSPFVCAQAFSGVQPSNAQLAARLDALGAHVAAQQIAPSSSVDRRWALAVERLRWARFEDPGLLTADSACGAVYGPADRVVAEFDALLQDPASTPDQRLGLRRDRWVALVSAGRSEEAVADWTASGSPQDLRPYVARALADALATEHRPRQAYALLKVANQADPGPFDPREADPRQAEAWAQYDQGDRAGGQAHMGALLHQEPAYRALTMPPRYEANDFGLADDQSVADMKADRGDVAGAVRHLQALVDRAPMNAGLLQDLAGLHARQNHVRLAVRELDRATTLDPRYPPTRATQSGVSLLRHDAVAAHEHLDPMICRYPRSAVVRRAQDELKRATGWQWDASVRGDKGHSPDLGSRSSDFEAEVWSPLWGGHWRGGLITRMSSASVPEGEVHRDRVGAGVRYETRDVVAYVQALASANTRVGQTAWEAGVDWAAADAWSFALAGSSASPETPLRAEAYGINAKTWTASATYQPSDQTLVRARYGQGVFSDGNRRQTESLTASQRVWTGSDSTVAATAEWSASQNTRLDQPYYDPAHDQAFLGGVTVNHLFRAVSLGRAEQRFDVQVGPYKEARFGRSWLAAATYGQTYTLRPGHSWGWQLGWRSQSYDGQRDHTVWLNLVWHRGS